MATVYVLTVHHNTPSGAPTIVPEVFDSLDGAKEYAKENWGQVPKRWSPSLWVASPEGAALRIHKRTVFKR